MESLGEPKISDISDDSPASKAGLQKGDIIIKLGLYKVTNLSDYSNALKYFKPSDSIELIYLHEGKENKTQIELMAK